jgi:hypothetical protein
MRVMLPFAIWRSLVADVDLDDAKDVMAGKINRVQCSPLRAKTKEVRPVS